jgi:hypothetical protein
MTNEDTPDRQHHRHHTHSRHLHGGRRSHSRRKTRVQKLAKSLGVAAFILLIILVGIYAWILSDRDRSAPVTRNLAVVRMLA